MWKKPGLLAGAAIAIAGFLATSAAADVPVCPGTGSCSKPRGVAVDFETGNLYVADSGNARVDIFKSNGTEVGTPASFPVSEPRWIAVDNVASSTSHHDVYLSSGFTVKKFEPNGTLADEFGEGSPEPCQFEESNDPIAVGPGGDVYVADSYEESAGVFAHRIVKFSATGGCVGEVPLQHDQVADGSRTILDLAVDSTGSIYVTLSAGGVLRKYGPTGELVKEFEHLQTGGLAVDEADNLFAEQRVEHPGALVSTEYSPSGAILRRFDYAPGFLPAFLAAQHSADGDLYASDGSAVTYRSLPAPGPVFFPEPCRVKNDAPGSVRATLEADVNPEGRATTVKAQYLTQAQWEAGGFNNPDVVTSDPIEIEIHVKPGTPEEEAKEEEEQLFSLQEAAITVEPLEPETEYHCRIVATNSDSGPGGTVGEEGEFKTGPPFEFGPSWSAEVGPTEATIYAEGNPEGEKATGQIEYITEAQYQANGETFAGAQLSSPPLDYGSGETMVVGLDENEQPAHLTGLTPGTAYRYRLRAFNADAPEGIVCPEEKASCPEFEHTFHTFAAAEERPDDRGYELVSPGQKNSAEVGGPNNGRGFQESRSVLAFAAAPSGEAITYTSWTSFGQAQGAPPTSQYLSTRSSEMGWQTENISPAGFQASFFVPPYLGFSEGLEFGAVRVGGPGESPLAADCPAGFENLYLREPSGALRCLTPEVPDEPDESSQTFGYFFTYGGSSEDGSRVFFRTRAGYAGVESSWVEPSRLDRYNLYEWHEGRLHPVGILPDQSEAIPPTRNSAFGANSSEPTQTGQTFLRHAISADGTRVIWTYVPEAAANLTPVGPGAWTLGIENAAKGTFTLSFEGQTTAPIAYSIEKGVKATVIQAALEALSTVGAGNVEVSGVGPFTVTFKGALAGTAEPLSANSSGLVAVPSRLLDRIGGTTTIQLDEKRSAGGTSGNGLFWAASTDGSVVYFTSPNRLTTGAKAEEGAEDLYRVVLGPEPVTESTLTDLTSGGGKGFVAGNVQGVLGASDDGSRIYFVARAALTPEAEENESGEHAEEGQDNLYLYDGTEGKTSFIATLSEEDSHDWETQPRVHSSRVSPDGLHLAFLSTEAKKLAGYDNELVHSEGRFGEEGKHCQLDDLGITLIGSASCPEAFLYDAQDNALHCASCNPAGSRPLGPATLPGWTNMAEGPRYLSNDGSRFFFESFDRLLPGDESLKRDVYEFELPGAGTCTTASSVYVPTSGGCLFLVSSGKSEDENHLIDASADGNDVFFSTRDRILPGRDPNENYDIYDYRMGGGFAEPAEPVICASPEACKPPASSPPSPPSPATPTFNGPGNPKPKHPCRKGFVRKHGKCVRKHHKTHHKRKGREHGKKHHGSKGRAGR